MLLTDLAQYWFHRAFHRVPVPVGLPCRPSSAKAMDWLAGARMHFVEIILLRGVTSLPLFTFGFAALGDAGLYRHSSMSIRRCSTPIARRFRPASGTGGDAALPPLASRRREGRRST